MNLKNLTDVVIYPFFECNLGCKGCPVKRPGKSGLLSLDPDEFTSHVETDHLEIVASWRADNYIILGGEPFLSSYLPKIIDVLSSSGDVIVYTNATLLTDADPEVLEGISRLVVSLEGGSDWTRKIRGKGVYEKAWKVLERFSEYVDVSVRMGYFEENLESVINEMKKLESHEIPVMLFPRLDKEPMDMNTTYYFYNVVATFDKADILLPSYKNFIGVRDEGVGCPAGEYKLTLTPEGYLTPCQWINVPLAHVEMDDDVIEYEFYRWRYWNYNIPDECHTCQYKLVCRGSCKAAKDYISCPVRKATISDVSVDVFGEVRVVDSKKVKMKASSEVVIHGCSAGC